MKLNISTRNTVTKPRYRVCVVITRTTQYFNKIQKNSNSEQHFDCFIESTFRLGCSHQDWSKITEVAIYIKVKEVELLKYNKFF